MQVEERCKAILHKYFFFARILHYIRDLISYKITDLNPLEIVESVSGTGRQGHPVFIVICVLTMGRRPLWICIFE